MGMDKVIMIKRYINSNDNPYYVDENEFYTQLNLPSTNKAKLTVFEDPELTKPVVKNGKILRIPLVDVIMNRIK
jgi:cell division septal protein FtsQ